MKVEPTRFVKCCHRSNRRCQHQTGKASLLCVAVSFVCCPWPFFFSLLLITVIVRVCLESIYWTLSLCLLSSRFVCPFALDSAATCRSSHPASFTSPQAQRRHWTICPLGLFEYPFMFLCRIPRCRLCFQQRTFNTLAGRSPFSLTACWSHVFRQCPEKYDASSSDLS